jgi:hypothetical protein
MLKNVIRLLLQIFGSCFVALGVAMFGSATYTTATLPSDQLNESAIGFVIGLFSMAAGGIALFFSKFAQSK